MRTIRQASPIGTYPVQQQGFKVIKPLWSWILLPMSEGAKDRSWYRIVAVVGCWERSSLHLRRLEHAVLAYCPNAGAPLTGTTWARLEQFLEMEVSALRALLGGRQIWTLRSSLQSPVMLLGYVNARLNAQSTASGQLFSQTKNRPFVTFYIVNFIVSSIAVCNCKTSWMSVRKFAPLFPPAASTVEPKYQLNGSWQFALWVS
eukprot:symbB.v1.2.015736.t1/scaffold1123.1/size136624/1